MEALHGESSRMRRWKARIKKTRRQKKIPGVVQPPCIQLRRVGSRLHRVLQSEGRGVRGGREGRGVRGGA